MIRTRKPKDTVMFNRLILDEYRACAADPLYFITKYLKLSLGKEVVPLFDSQTTAVAAIQEFDQVLLKTPRRCGFTSIAFGYLIWEAMFSVRRQIVVVLPNSVMLGFALRHALDLYDTLPFWFEKELSIANRAEIRFKNGSTIRFVPATAQPKGSSIGTLYIADIGCIPRPTAESLLYSILPACSSSSRIIVNSEESFHGLESMKNFELIRL